MTGGMVAAAEAATGRAMRLLELGTYIAPNQAGMLLAEQGYQVTKWTHHTDPTRRLRDGARLWEFLTDSKTVLDRHSATVVDVAPGEFDAVLDNHTAASWRRWGVDPDAEAVRLGVAWVSIVADVPDVHGGQRSFDAFAQARAFGPDCPPVPFYIGDTVAGLTAAFVLAAVLAAGRVGRVLVSQAAALAKLREGDLAVRPPAGGWDEPGSYYVDTAGAHVAYGGRVYDEPARDDAWRWANLRHVGGRLQLGAPSRRG